MVSKSVDTVVLPGMDVTPVELAIISDYPRRNNHRVPIAKAGSSVARLIVEQAGRPVGRTSQYEHAGLRNVH